MQKKTFQGNVRLVFHVVKKSFGYILWQNTTIHLSSLKNKFEVDFKTHHCYTTKDICVSQTWSALMPIFIFCRYQIRTATIRR